MHVNSHRILRFTALLVAAGCGVTLLAADNWPRFRGPAQNGTSPQAGLLQTWPEKGPDIVWNVPIGPGFSGIAVDDKKLVTMFGDGPEDNRQEYLAAYQLKNGKELWRLALGKEFVNEFGNGPRSTPSLADGKVVALSSYGRLVCVALKNGKILWEKDLVKDHENTTVPRFGFSSSPLIDGGNVLIDLPGQKENGYLALSLTDGKEQWRKVPAGNGYISPVAIDLEKKHQYLVLSGPQLSAIDPAGNVLWQKEWTGSGVANPLVINPNRIFVSASGDIGGLMLEIDAAQDPVVIKELWRSRSMKNHFNSSVTDGKYIYGFDNATLKCIAVEDGKTLWAKRGFGKGSLILADAKLWVVSDRGVLAVVKAQPDAYEEIGQSTILEGKCWTAPSLVQGLLLVRNGTHMTAIRVAAGG